MLVVLLLASSRASGQAYSILHEFSARAGNPLGGLIQGSDGKLYGALNTGGEAGYGSVYSLTPDGAGGYTYAEVYGVTPADAAIGFSGGLLQAADGGLYGATYFPQGGVIYRVDPSGSFAVMHTFTGSEGTYPGVLMQSSGGDFYGVTSLAAFRMDTSGNVTLIHTFTGAEGTGPVGPLLLASDGFLYGVCESGGGGHGTVFRMDLNGSLTMLYSFSGPDGSGPQGGLIEGSDGFLYGTTYSGGDSGLGTVFRISTSGTLTTLHSLAASEGSMPTGKLLQASDGKFYGATFDNGADPGTLFQIDAAGNFTTIHAFSSAEGIWPQGSLIEVGGKFVGSAYRGGADGYGTAFTVTPLGTLAVVQSFAGPPEGNFPAAGLTQASDGLLYGTACFAGDSGAGTLFRTDLAGNLTRLHSFDGSTEGACPAAALIEASDGNLYGTAAGGGAGGHGTVFRSSTSGAITTLHAFSVADGDTPESALVQATDGNFYGSTVFGGDSGRGILFRVDGAGGFSLLHSISTTEGAYPSGLVQGSDGGLYGSTAGGSVVPSIFFRMDTSGSITTLHAFGSGGNDANRPLIGQDGAFYAARGGGVYRLDLAGNFTTIHPFQYPDVISYPSELVQTPDGRLWGRGLSDGELYLGAVFRVDLNGDLTIVHRFLGPDGGDPDGRLLLASDGLLYGTTAHGGQFQGGVVYRIDPAQVIDIAGVTPASGPPSGGTSVTIAGVNFQPGATVTIGFVPATNVVVSGGSEITATTPALAAGAAYDVVVDNPDLSRATRSRAWVADAADVAPSDLYHDAVTRLFRSGVSVGCGDGLYCVDASVTRAQMAVLLLKGRFGPYYQPPPATGAVFGDVPATAFAAAFIEDLFARGISEGCGGGNYCPDDPVTRAQMAPLLLKTLLGPSYAPPPATGKVFGDVAPGDFAADFIEDVANRGIAAGCSASPPLYCPSAVTTRGQMAAFVISTFGLP